MVSGTRSNPAKDDAASEAAGVEAPAMPAQEAEVTGGSEVEGVRVGAEGSLSRGDMEEAREVGAEGCPSRADTVEARMAGARGSLATSGGGRRDSNRMILGALADIINTLQGMVRQVADQSDIINTLQQRMTAMEADGNAEQVNIAMEADLDWEDESLDSDGARTEWKEGGGKLMPNDAGHLDAPQRPEDTVQKHPCGSQHTEHACGNHDRHRPSSFSYKDPEYETYPIQVAYKIYKAAFETSRYKKIGTARSLTLDVRRTGC